MNFFDSFFKKDNDQEMKFSLEIGPQTDLSCRRLLQTRACGTL